MEILLIFLGFLVFFLNSSKTPCQDIKFQPFISCDAYFFKCYIFEGDDEDYSKIQHIDTQLIKPSFIIPFQDEPIQIKIIEPPDQKQKIQEKLMCTLFRKHEYYITCISFDFVYQEENINFSEKVRFDTKIVASEICDQMDINEDGSLNLFCLGQFTLQQYTLNLSIRNVTLILEHDVHEQIQDFCKIQYMKLNQNEYIVAFYQCTNWKILLIQKSEITTLLESQMKDNEIMLQKFSFINQVSFCEHNQLTQTLFLIENDFYLEVIMNYKQKSISNYFLYQHTKHIQKVIVQTNCQIIIVANSLEDRNSKANDSSILNEITLNLNYSNYNIHFHSDLLFLQNQSQLHVYLDAHLNQTYQISNTQLHFFDIFKLFCQFDQSKRVLQFYGYYQLRTFIKPKQKYLYLIQRKNLFQKNNFIRCLRIIYENNTKEEKQQQVQQLILQNNCQGKIQQTVYVQNTFKNSSFKLYNSEGSINLSIRNNHKFVDSCFSNLQQFHFKGKIELRQLKIPYYIYFQNETSFYIYDCQKNKLLIQINRDKFEVLESHGDYIIVQKNISNILRVIQFKNDQLIQFKINFIEEIISVQQTSEYVFLYMNNSNLLPLIYQIYQTKYLSKSLYQSEQILFYYEEGQQKFIQYLNIIAVENQGNIRCFKFQEAFIISIQIYKNTDKDYSILAIQNLTRSIILNYFYDHEIHQISNYSFSEYQFSYPFKYKISSNHLAILIQQNTELYIAIFQYNIFSLQLLEITATDSDSFIFYQNNLLYTLNNEWIHLLLEQILVELEINTNFQNNLESLYQTDFYPSKQKENSIQLKVQILNYCYKLYPLKNLNKMNIQKNQIVKLNISDIFHGPINNLTLITNSSIVLNGPFQFRKELLLCSPNNSNFCIRQYNQEYLTEQLMFLAIIKENQIFQIINIISLNQIIYITFIKQTYYLQFSLYLDNLQIQLIQCLNESCNIIQDLNDRFKIQSINEADIMRTGNLIKLKQELNQTFIYFEDTHFITVQITGLVLDVIYIEDSQNQYLIIKQKNVNSIDLELIIYSINLDQINILYSQQISEEFYFQLTSNRTQKNQEYKFTSCIYIEGIFKIKLFILNQYYSYLFQVILNQQMNQVQFELLKSIRNCFSFNYQSEKITIKYLDEEILILKQNQFYFYDLREERNFYDYVYKSMNSINLKRINTTHFTFLNNQIIHLGTIGYEIEQQNSSEIDYNFELFAQNDISDEKVSFQIHIIEQMPQFTKTILLIQFSCLIFIIIYLRSTKSRNQYQQKRNKLKTLSVSQIRDI